MSGFNISTKLPPVDKLTFKLFRFDLPDSSLEISIPEKIFDRILPTIIHRPIKSKETDIFNSENKRQFMRAIYDFPKNTWFNKKYGSMIMTACLHIKPETYTENIMHRENLIKAIQLDLKHRYQEFNDRTWHNGLASGKLSTDLINETMNFSANTDEKIQNNIFNNKRWISHFIGGLEKHRVYCIALTNNHYLSIDFEDKSEKNIPFDKMIEISTPYSDAIMQTAKIKPHNNNTNE